MFKFFFAAVAITTLLSMGMIGKVGKVKSYQETNPAPIMIDTNGGVTFPQRMPSPEVMFKIRDAVKAEDAQRLNAILLEHNFFVAPNKG